MKLPDELVERAAKALLSAMRHEYPLIGFSEANMQGFKELARAALEAALSEGGTIEEVGEPGYYDHHGNDGAFVAPGRYLVIRLDAPG